MGAPVCNVNPTSPVPVGRTPLLPSVPRATDLASAIAAINALQQLINALYGGSGGSGGGASAAFGGAPGSAQQGAASPKQQQQSKPPAAANPKASTFSEVRARRIVKTVRIYDPNNKNVYVDVQQIVGLTLTDGLTNATWNWTQ